MLRVDLNKLLNWNRISQNAQLEIQELFYNYSLLALWAAGLVKCRNALGRVDWQPPPSSHTQSYSGLHSMLRVDLNKLLNWNRISQNAQLEIQELFYNYSLLALWAAGLVKCRNALGRVDWQPPHPAMAYPINSLKFCYAPEFLGLLNVVILNLVHVGTLSCCDSLFIQVLLTKIIRPYFWLMLSK